MNKITNLKELKSGAFINFDYKGTKAILVKTASGKVVAYSSVCPHEGGIIEWDINLHKLLCECHLSIFNVEDGSVYRYSSVFDNMKNLTPIPLKIDDKQDVYAL